VTNAYELQSGRW